MFKSVLDNVQTRSPLVHAITNYVTVNDCANTILASGGSPIMADDIAEVGAITAICSALVINMGTLNARTIESMLAAGKKANALARPVVFDPVGAGASPLRNDTAITLLKEVQFSVLRGNISEMKFLATGIGNTQGVDAAVADAVTEDNLASVIALAQGLADRVGAVVAVTGAIDVVSDGQETYTIKNGHPMLSRITGSGCMLSSLAGCFCGANPEQILRATATAVVVLGLCGELAYQKLCEIDGGVNTYRSLLIDYLGKMDLKTLTAGAKIERV